MRARRGNLPGCAMLRTGMSLNVIGLWEVCRWIAGDNCEESRAFWKGCILRSGNWNGDRVGRGMIKEHNIRLKDREIWKSLIAVIMYWYSREKRGRKGSATASGSSLLAKTRYLNTSHSPHNLPIIMQKSSTQTYQRYHSFQPSSSEMARSNFLLGTWPL